MCTLKTETHTQQMCTNVGIIQYCVTNNISDDRISILHKIVAVYPWANKTISVRNSFKTHFRILMMIKRNTYQLFYLMPLLSI